MACYGWVITNETTKVTQRATEIKVSFRENHVDLNK